MSKKHTTLIPIFGKKTPFSQKHEALMSVFPTLSWKTPYYNVHNWSKKRNSVKPVYTVGQKSQQDTLFARFFTKITTLSRVFCEKNIQSLTNMWLSSPYFAKKKSILSKHGARTSFFFNFFMKNPCGHAHDWSNKRQFCQNYTLLWAKKVNRMDFFPIFHEKSLLLPPSFSKTSFL